MHLLLYSKFTSLSHLNEVIFSCTYFYIVNVPTFSHKPNRLYLSFIHFVVLKRTWIWLALKRTWIWLALKRTGICLVLKRNRFLFMLHFVLTLCLLFCATLYIVNEPQFLLCATLFWLYIQLLYIPSSWVNLHYPLDFSF